MSANSDRDVVNLFYGFINAPENQDLSKEYLDIKMNILLIRLNIFIIKSIYIKLMKL